MPSRLEDALKEFEEGSDELGTLMGASKLLKHYLLLKTTEMKRLWDLDADAAKNVFF